MQTTFSGIPAAAFQFYRDLEQDNSRPFWSAHLPVYEESIRDPLLAILEELAGEFGAGKLFRPYRDVRFSPDKRPFKEHQGAFVRTSDACGYYLQVGPDGLLIGGGWYAGSPDHVARFRTAVDNASSGEQLAGIIAALRAAGHEIGGETLKSRPRGVPADHPRVDLLRHRSLTAVVSVDAGEGWVGTAAALDHVGAVWRQVKPMVDWIGEHVTGLAEAAVP